MQLSIIIPSFNTRELLKNCLDSIHEQTKNIKFEVIVVDNGSKDGSPQMVKKKFPKVRLIVNKKNLFYAKANNQGIKIAKGKHILLLNSDTEIINNAINKMINWMDKHPKVGVAGCQLLNTDRSIQPSGGFLPTLPKLLLWQFFLDDLPFIWRIIKPYQLSKKSFYKKEHLNFGWVTGAFFIVRKEVIQETGSFDKDAPFYVEEVEWCHRIKKAGWRIGFNPKAQIIHHKGASSKKGFEAAVLGEYEGLKYFFKKYKPGSQSFIKLIFLGGALLRVLLFGIINPSKAKAYWEAIKIISNVKCQNSKLQLKTQN